MSHHQASTVFEQIFNKYYWKPIRNCPGRFILSGGASKLSVEEIISEPVKTYRCVSEKVPDEILVAGFNDGGGLISYLKEDDKFLHTLNDQDGFERKLNQLEIELPKDDEA